MNQKSVPCDLEVIHPVASIPMNHNNFNVCLGILIDNAIEAVEKIAQPKVSILLAREEKSLTVVVSNPVAEAVDCQHIGEYGHSTKDKNRGGWGYSVFKKIISKYPNIISLTNCSHNFFVQEMKIMDI